MGFVPASSWLQYVNAILDFSSNAIGLRKEQLFNNIVRTRQK